MLLLMLADSHILEHLTSEVSVIALNNAHLRRIFARVALRERITFKQARKGVVRVHDRSIILYDCNAFGKCVKNGQPAIETLFV